MDKDKAAYLKKQGIRIRLARHIADMTQEELAEKMTAELGFYFGDDVKVSRIERGKQDVSGREIAALSVVLNQPVPWLQGIEDEGMNPPIIDGLSSWFPRPIDANLDAGRLIAA